MTFKKIMSAVMAGAMVLSLGATAFASSTPGTITLETADPYEFSVESQTQVPAMKIVVPEAVGVIANPYKLTVDATSIGGTATESDVIISPVQYIKNLSLVDVDVKATVAGYVSDEVVFATADPDTTVKAKQAHVTFEMGLCDGSQAPGTYPNSVKLTATETPVAVGSSALTMLKSADGSTVGATGAVGFHFTGKLTPNEQIDTSVQAPWNEGDVFGAAVAFTFTAKTNS